MTEQRFRTPRPVGLYVEIGKGSVTVDAVDTSETYVVVSGRDADSVEVRQDGDQISVVAPRQRTGFFGSDSALTVNVTVPTDSDVSVKTGSADITVDGRVGTGQFKTGSGDISAAVLGGSTQVMSGSGDIRVGQAESALNVSTGSGDVQLGVNHGPVSVKTGSGDFAVDEAHEDVTLTSGSGDLWVRTAHRGRLTANSASGDLSIGIPAGIPVWTDIFTLTGEIRSDLVGAGQPADGADHVEVRAKTASGDIHLRQL